MRKIKENELKRELENVRKKEKKFLNRSSLRNPLKEAVYERVPEKLQKVLEGAFERAFGLVFQKGTAVIEKTFDREGAALEFEAAVLTLLSRFACFSIRRRLFFPGCLPTT